MDLQIQLAGVDDLPDVLRVQALSLRTLSVGHYSERQIEYLVKSKGEVRAYGFRHGGELVYVARLEAEIGPIAALPVGPPRIGWVFVHPGFVRQGIALKLLAKLEEAAAIRRYPKLRVTSSLSAVPVYEKAGYCRKRNSQIKVTDEVIECVDLSKTLIPRDARYQQREKMFVIALAIVFLLAVIVSLLNYFAG